VPLPRSARCSVHKRARRPDAEEMVASVPAQHVRLSDLPSAGTAPMPAWPAGLLPSGGREPAEKAVDEQARPGNFGWGTWIRTRVDGVRVRSPTARRSPSRGSTRRPQYNVAGSAEAGGIYRLDSRVSTGHSRDPSKAGFGAEKPGIPSLSAGSGSRLTESLSQILHLTAGSV
jgi:hypothetical protein